MRSAERIIFAFRPLGEAGQAAAHSDRANSVTSTGEDLVRVALVADVPDQSVGRGIEDIVDGNRQFDHPEPGTKMSTGNRHRRYGFAAKLVAELRQLIL